MHLLIAPNAFKHALDARRAAMAIAEGIREANNNFTVTVFPVGDGGDGTGRLLTEHCRGEFISKETIDPLGRKINAVFGLIDQGKTAVIEMAAASGLHLLGNDELAPLQATTEGTGRQIKQALDHGVKKIILCVGGSATVDGGVGILRALGVRFLDKNGHSLQGIPGSLSLLDSIDKSGIDQRILSTDIIILCDVKNMLLGNQGAASVFGPQKGASVEDVQQLESGLARFTEIIRIQTGIDVSQIVHGGAAGGTAAGLHALLGAKLVNGIDHFLSLTGFDQVLGKADRVITGEGRIDLQTLDGKAPFGVAVNAKNRSIPVTVFAGSIDTANESALHVVFDELININTGPVDIATAIAATHTNLVNAAKQLVVRLSRQ
jgi:glycerate kinase